MAEWVEATVAELLALKPEHVLEIGCGSGLLLARVAPMCRSYLGTDYSAEAVAHILRLRDSLPELANVRAMQRMADDFSGLCDQSFDLVILNSVAQYFPSVDYFLRVLAGAVRVLKPGGVMVLGDLRSQPLLAAYHASVQLHQATDDLSRADLAARVRQKMVDEEELLLDPALFQALPHHLPQIRRVGVRLKRGQSHNELTRFRYQVLLQVGEADEPLPEAPSWPSQDWEREGWSIGALRDHLRQRQPDRLVVRNIPNARLQAEARTLEWLASSAHNTVGAWREQLAEPGRGIDPEALWALADELTYTVELTHATRGKATAMDLYLERRTTSVGAALPPALPFAERLEPWRAYANNPLLGKLQRRLVPQLRSHLAAQLPEHMVPAAFLALDAMPLTPNGKLDRKALPALKLAYSTTFYTPPEGPVEEALATLWTELLGSERVGRHDDFFALGGHSLLWSTSAGPTSRSRFAVSASSSARSRRRCGAVTEFERRWCWPARMHLARSAWWPMSPSRHAGCRHRATRLLTRGLQTSLRCQRNSRPSCGAACRITCCRRPLWCWRPCPSHQTGSWTARPCRRLRRTPTPPVPTRRPRVLWKRPWRTLWS